MTKDFLKQYRFCKKRIAELNEEIDRLKRENKNLNIIQNLYNEQSECRNIISEVSIFVENIEDVMIRRAFIMRYMEGASPPKWEKIALKIGGSNTADSIRKAVTRFIAKN